MVQGHRPDLASLLLFVSDDPERVRERYQLQGASIHRISRLEGEGNISPANVDRAGQVAELHCSRRKGKTLVLIPVVAEVAAEGVKPVTRLLEVLYEVAVAQEGEVLVHLDPRKLTLAERRSLERSAHVVRVGKSRDLAPGTSKE